eukprot:CAMPEP_0198704374 /NCGR_PEP_ID=MMETSP1468-20131203/389870_1 /TAXON_ID=1461545 /ORGANISM="Mantoniella sp, Strain CCMP1436" /LENGTH=201 /DNA_ID=CAMNT_0044463185 /DNA_START=555 /DNA_END=1160 /DNA_ORIENTATION=-
MGRATANHRFLVVSALREIVEPQLNNKFAVLTVSATVYNPIIDPFNLNGADPSGCAAGTLPSTSSVVIQKLKNIYLDDEEYVGFEPAQGAATRRAGHTKQGGSGDFIKKAQTLLQTFKIQTFAQDFAPDFGAEYRRDGRRTEAPRQSTVRVSRPCGIVLGFGARRWRRVCAGKGRALHGRAKRLWRQTFLANQQNRALHRN